MKLTVLRSAALALACLFGVAAASAQTGYTTVTGSQLHDATGTLVTNSTIRFQPVNSQGVPLSFRAGGAGGQTIAYPVSTTVTAGSFSIVLADTTLTAPANPCYSVSLISNLTGRAIPFPGYTCIQPSGSTWSFDAYIPSSIALPLQLSGCSLAVGTVTLLSTGASPTITNSGSTCAAVLNFGIPLAPGGSGSYDAAGAAASALSAAEGYASTAASSAQSSAQTFATSAVAAERTTAANASNLGSGTVALARLPGAGVTTIGGTACTIGGSCSPSTGGGAGNPSTCTASSATDICLTLAPYYASPNGDITTTTSGSLTSGSTTATVASCSTFVAGNGVLITGAGASGANYIGTVSTCSGTTLTFTPATSTTVASGAVVQHDETAAIQSAITSLVGSTNGGTLWFPSGTYLVYGPLQNTGTSNTVLDLSNGPLNLATAVPVAFSGVSNRPPRYNSPAGAFLVFNNSSGNSIGGFSSTGSYGGFTNVNFSMSNLTLVNKQTTFADTSHCMVYAKFLPTLDLKHVVMYSGASGTATTGCGFYAPTLSNNVDVDLGDVTVVGFGALGYLSEHATFTTIRGANSHFGLVMETQNGTNPGASTHGNSVTGLNYWCQLCDYQITAGASQTTISIASVDAEVATTYVVYDPTSLLYGNIGVNVPYSDGRSTSTPVSLAVNGGTNLNICNLKTSVCSRSGSSGSSGPPTAGETNFWAMNEGSGTTLNDLVGSNPLTLGSGITWSGGYPLFPTGNNRAAYAASLPAVASRTAPFSIAFWVKPTVWIGAGQSTLFSNTAVTTPGFEIDRPTSDKIEIAFISSVSGSNYIDLNSTATGLIPISTPTHVCVTYSGSSTAAGFTLYINGAASALATIQDTLTGSVTSTTQFSFMGSPTTTAGTFDNSPAGEMDHAHVYNRALSAGECSALAAGHI
jgi:hypothetical protein